MASYFDLPPQQKAGSTNIEAMPEEQRRQLGRASLLSPAVTQLLDDWGQEQSDSDSEEVSLSEDEDDTKHTDKHTKKNVPQHSRQDRILDTKKTLKDSHSPRKGDQSPTKVSAHVRLPPARSGGGGSLKPRQPHMARFHSLRSMLFSSNIEDKVKNMSQEDCEKEEAVADRWKRQHEERQMRSRPKTPEKDADEKEHGLGSRIKTKIRRMTSKEIPTMETLKEDGAAHDFSDHGSTASSDNEAEQYQWKPREADEESIDHSDVEDLVRWVSRRDPPSDGEARVADKAPTITLTKEDSGHDSIGQSDVDDLVQWVSRKSSGPQTKQDIGASYSDASTESDSEMAKEHDSSENEDADDLVRWISRRDGSTAGPVRRKQQDGSNSSETGSHINYDSDVPEIGRWIKRHDGTSGESGATTPARDTLEEPERGRPLSREGPQRNKQKGHLTDNDVNELVKWVSRKDSKQQSPPQYDQEVDKLQRREEEKKQQLGMTVDEGSLSHSDVQDLIQAVKSSDLTFQGPEPTVTASSTIADSPVPSRPGEAERGDLRKHRTTEREVSESEALGHLKASRSENTQINNPEKRESSEGRDSLGDEDVDELVKWVSRKT
jgi:hypothetical protein